LSLVVRPPELLAAPTDGHYHADEDGSCHDYSEQVLQDYGPRVRAGYDICDQGVYPIDYQYYYWSGLYLHPAGCPACYGAIYSVSWETPS